MKLFNVKLTEIEIEHIMNLIIENKEEGTYWGNREQHRTRIDRIEEALGTLAEEIK